MKLAPDEPRDDLALAFAFASLEARGRAIGWRTAAVLTAVIAAGSLHDVYTVIGPRDGVQTLLLQVAAALVLAGVLSFSVARRRERRGVVTQVERAGDPG